MSLIQGLLEKPRSLTRVSKYTALNGVIYLAVGILLVAYATYGLTRPPLGPFKITAPADIAIGFSNGLLGGLTGLGGIISTISCQLRGWSKDKQRAVFQPVLFAAFVIISISQLVAGSYSAETLKL